MSQNSHLKLQPVRGTQDILPELADKFRKIDNIAYATSQTYGFSEIDTPIFESSDVFHRTLGETSDMVSKETYTFTDRGGDSITLRPEGTAGIARAFISNGLTQNLPLKLYYSGPMFRYERPQKGRYRQFHQIGVEVLGYDDVFADVECIALAHKILSNLGLQEFVTLELNSLGDTESRGNHRTALVDYLDKYKSELSADSQVRLEKNPLRILDSKDAGDRKILETAPSLQNYLNDSSKNFFERLQNSLASLKIPFKIQSSLVRGIDYYTHTVFEFTTDKLGAQSAVLAGGRYDGLISQMGGPQTPGVGWASGLERLALLCEHNWQTQQKFQVVTIAGDEASEKLLLKIGSDLRSAMNSGLNKKLQEQVFSLEYLGSGSIGKKFKKANKMAANFALVLGEDELKSNLIQIKNLQTGNQVTVAQQVESILAAMDL